MQPQNKDLRFELFVKNRLNSENECRRSVGKLTVSLESGKS
jgi:hypothetical protein